MQRLCPRCRNAVTLPEDGTLQFCVHCGAPQVLLAEDLLERISLDRGDLAEREAAATAGPVGAPVAPGEVDWRGAIQCAALSGVVALALSLLSRAVAPAVLLSLFWGLGAPVVVLGIYASRFRATRIYPGFAARLGVLTGAAVLLGSAAVNITTMLLDRFLFHRTGDLDAQLNARMHDVQASMTQQSGAAAAPLVNMLNVPEFRAGIVLGSFALFAVGYLLFSAAGGAFAGMLRARRPAR